MITPVGSRYPILMPLGSAAPPAAAAGGGWWDDFGNIGCCVVAYQPVGAANLAASYTDLSGNGNNCGPGVAPGWDPVLGWIFTGTQWLDTGVVPGAGWSCLIQIANASNGFITGESNGVKAVMRIRKLGGSINYSNGQPSVSVAPTLVTGNLGVAGNCAYRDGVDEGVTLGAWVGNTTFPNYIGASNQVGSPTIWPGGKVRAYALYDCVLDASEMATVRAYMAAL